MSGTAQCIGTLVIREEKDDIRAIIRNEES